MIIDNGDGKRFYKQHRIQQHPNIITTFPSFFEKEKFNTVIEIGTAQGGFAIFLGEQSIEHNFKFVTYDIEQFSPVSDHIKNLNIDMRVGNTFEQKTINEIIEL